MVHPSLGVLIRLQNASASLPSRRDPELWTSGTWRVGETVTHSTRIVEPASWRGEVESRPAGAHPKNIVNVGVNAGSVSVSHVFSSVRCCGGTSGRARERDSGVCISRTWRAYEASMRSEKFVEREEKSVKSAALRQVFGAQQIWFRPFSS
jgi:hypothetical protein